MDYKEALEKLQENPELEASLKAALDKGAAEDEVASILAAAGFDAGSAEALVAEYQRKRGLVISDDDLDESQMKAVAGGTLHNCEMPMAEALTDCEQIAIPR